MFFTTKPFQVYKMIRPTYIVLICNMQYYGLVYNYNTKVMFCEEKIVVTASAGIK